MYMCVINRSRSFFLVAFIDIVETQGKSSIRIVIIAVI